MDKEAALLANEPILKVAINAPLRTLFDYLPPKAGGALLPGMRVRVPFGRTRQVGLLVALAPASDVPSVRLRRVEEILDLQPLLGAEDMDLLLWAARYYAHPVGEVFATAIPTLARQGRRLGERRVARAAAAASPADAERLAGRAPRQAAILRQLLAAPLDLETADDEFGPGWRGPFRRLEAQGLVEITLAPADSEGDVPGPDTGGPTLTPSQAAAVENIIGAPGPGPVLLFGVTGSGKTEVYLRAIESVLAEGRQALVLVPEIGLTPQTVRRFRRRFGCRIAVLHSGLTEKVRLEAWMDARSGRARIVIGTRSAVFTPMPDCGLIAVDEEHDPSFKQQEGFRYSARDIAVVRAHRSGIPVVLGSATPSLESMRNADAGRYRRVDLAERAGSAARPVVRVVDLRVTPAREGLTTPLLQAMQRHLDGDGQVILFLNRRGYATALFCSECGWVAECPRCDARMTVHQHPAGLRCHHCNRSEQPPSTCRQCGAGLRPVGQGTERIEAVLAAQFPDLTVGRLDRDTAKTRESLTALLEDMRQGRTRILVGTQMLTKGHDFPDVTLVGVLNCDQGLFGTDFRSDERLAQTILQVSGRAGRRERRGEVILQTSYPQHRLLSHLVSGGYADFTREALDERAAAGWPPFSHLAMLRAEATGRGEPMGFLQRCRDLAEGGRRTCVSILGPAPAPMERRSGRYRAQLLFRSTARPDLHALLNDLLPAVESLKESRRVRWSLDVDPVELF